MKSLAVTADKAATGSSAASEADRAKIEGALEAYEAALNASDTDKVMAVFASDGVFMAPNSPSAVGLDAVLGAYNGIFHAIAFDTELHVDEIVQVAADWAFVRTHSAGFVTVNATNDRVADANHELFVFRKDDDAWKIARYSFSSTNPPPR
ncbi:YybH family protein [Methylopila sp. Yamaguchi]|uniref:YybH family protein n=1 Tax=Methylopila sp. Yamaguchi TaxID=1437817 RepID=UPI00135BCB32|nr:nuclear transport factor 2 family protein [Methylopila sp. Yamaguchi]